MGRSGRGFAPLRTRRDLAYRLLSRISVAFSHSGIDEATDALIRDMRWIEMLSLLHISIWYRRHTRLHSRDWLCLRRDFVPQSKN
jgi:hypothetical protein